MKPTKKIEAVVPIEQQKKTAAEKWLEDVKKFDVDGPESRTKAIEKLGEIKQATKDAEKERDLLLDPAKATVKAITNKWKPVLNVFEEADAVLRKKVTDHDAAVKAKALADLAKLDKKVEAGTISRPETIAKNTANILGTLPSRVVATSTGSAQTRQVPKLSIDDKNLIPDEYWIIDEVALRKAVVVEKKTVPGASIKYEDSLAIF